jgi:uncharacterized protein (DUF433 family)
MANLQQVEQMLHALTPGERAQLFLSFARDLGVAAPDIDSDPHICGGDPCIVRTRIPVWVLVQSRRLGMSEAELLKSYPALRAEDLVNAWAYEQSHTVSCGKSLQVFGRRSSPAVVLPVP